MTYQVAGNEHDALKTLWHSQFSGTRNSYLRVIVKTMIWSPVKLVRMDIYF